MVNRLRRDEAAMAVLRRGRMQGIGVYHLCEWMAGPAHVIALGGGPGGVGVGLNASVSCRACMTPFRQPADNTTTATTLVDVDCGSSPSPLEASFPTRVHIWPFPLLRLCQRRVCSIWPFPLLESLVPPGEQAGGSAEGEAAAVRARVEQMAHMGSIVSSATPGQRMDMMGVLHSPVTTNRLLRVDRERAQPQAAHPALALSQMQSHRTLGSVSCARPRGVTETLSLHNPIAGGVLPLDRRGDGEVGPPHPLPEGQGGTAHSHAARLRGGRPKRQQGDPVRLTWAG